MPRFTSDAQRRYFYRVASGKARKKKGGLTKKEAKQAIAENTGNRDLPERA